MLLPDKKLRRATTLLKIITYLCGCITTSKLTNRQYYMCQNLEKYVLYVDGGISQKGFTEGCGVLVDDLFITAGHVIESAVSPTIYYEGQTINLHKEDAIVYTFMDDNTLSQNGNDVAVFKLHGIISPLSLCDCEIEKVHHPINISYHHVYNTKIDSTLPTIFRRPDKIEPLQCDVEISDRIENSFLECHTSILLHKGSSGSPLLDGNRVLGILIAGQEGTDLCVFQTSTSIKQLIGK